MCFKLAFIFELYSEMKVSRKSLAVETVQSKTKQNKTLKKQNKQNPKNKHQKSSKKNKVMVKL